MTISTTAKSFLDDQHVSYSVLNHEPSHCSQETAEFMHISGEKLAKSVVLEDEEGYVMAVLPATHRLDENAIKTVTHRNLHLANEIELADLFHDCQLGAIPAVGQAFGIETIVDTALFEQGDIYFEGGDHENVIHLRGDDFEKLMQSSQSATISWHR